jgi:hypothetical protein
MEFGTLVHTGVLEHELVVQNYYVLDDEAICADILATGKYTKPRATKEYKNWLAETQERNANKTLISIDDWNAAVHIRKAIQAHPKASALLSQNGLVEHAMQWTHPTGVLMKGRPDKFIPDYHADYGLVVDLKTTDNSSPHAFTRTMAIHRYDISMANYCEGLEILTGKPYKACFIVVERDAPHVVMVYNMKDEDLALSKHIIYGEAVKFKQCQESGIWHGYDEPENDEVEVPAWAYPE